MAWPVIVLLAALLMLILAIMTLALAVQVLLDDAPWQFRGSVRAGGAGRAD